ncbi:Abhydrolase domain-containing protein 11 [Wickerhamomyces ciferrii]|uniref:Abhydrolase domain-containing protein 11 n=1 Tax=Wickerhamomyces ciferrii (strain ATCC 14091 / BCRC 22168 / CBS 111 / JCM 3599 / NBRC 0793 / NRRL Y-1031 F-60-10) TaxID=1206466 RepID=K0KL32_WICCF|nr:Abhydrolase domain-containing protein 11 [Wickerhamomyces ciferrii]CCH41803.1 Abhydrolase domain-containing protein 11 [Wickerhamomyces ciferrii]
MNILRRTFSTARPLKSALYDGTASSLAKNEFNDKLLSRDIPTVKLAYDLINDKTNTLKEGAPILILHGVFGSKSNNRSIAKQLNSRLERDVYTIDLRNHGDSPHNKRHDYPALAADVERFIEDNELPKPIIIGHSMGAKAAMALSLRRRDLIEILVSVDNSPVNLQPSSLFPKYVSILERIVNDKDIKTNKEADQYFAKFEKDQVVRQFLLQNIKKNKETGQLESRIPLDIMKNALVKGEIAAWEFDSNFSRWMGPSLFIRGTTSKYVPDDYIPEIGKFFPNFEIRDIEAGHWVMAEKPKETLDVLIDYIERNEDI